MKFVIWDRKTIKEFQKYLNENKFKYFIEWGAGMIATFIIKCEEHHKWFINKAYKDINYKLYGGGW